MLHFQSVDRKTNWTARALRWTYCAIVAWAAAQAFSATSDQHMQILAVAEFIAAAAFLFRSLELPALVVLITAFAINGASSGQGDIRLEQFFLGAAACFIVYTSRWKTEVPSAD
jgi:hypothetical protein